MKIITIVENDPITGIRYGTVEIPEYNNNIQRRLDRYNRFRSEIKRAAYTTRTKHK